MATICESKVDQPEKAAAGYITKREVAARLNKTIRTVEIWMSEGYLPFLKIGKGRRATVLFRWADVENHLQARFGVDGRQP